MYCIYINKNLFNKVCITKLNIDLINIKNLIHLSNYTLKDILYKINLNNIIDNPIPYIKDTIVFGYKKNIHNLQQDNILDIYDIFIFKYNESINNITGFNHNDLNFN